MLTSGVAATLVFHRADDDGVKERVGSHGLLTGRIEIRSAGGFARIGHQDDHSAALIPAALERAGTEKHGVIDRSTSPGRHLTDRRLQFGNVIGKTCELRHVLIKRENGKSVPRAQNLPNKVGSGFLLETDFFVCAHAGVDHDGQVQRLGSFRLKSVDLLLNALLKKLESFLR